jgi:hypothetical protein
VSGLRPEDCQDCGCCRTVDTFWVLVVIDALAMLPNLNHVSGTSLPKHQPSQRPGLPSGVVSTPTASLLYQTIKEWLESSTDVELKHLALSLTPLS